MPDYGYLDQLQAMRNQGAKKPAAPRKQSIVNTLQNNGQALQKNTQFQAPARGTPAAARTAAARQPATMQRDAGVSRPATPSRPSRPIAPPPRPASAPVNRTPTPSASFNYSAIAPSATGAYGGVAPAFEPPPMTDEEYLPTDSIYVAESAGIESDVQALLDSLKRERGAYDVDFGKALRNLGWDPGQDWTTNPGSGQWRTDDMTGAYGSAMNNQQNDFAGRGMLTSSFYGDAVEDLLSSFDRQRGDMFSGRQSTMDELLGQENAANTQKRQGLDRARAAALARRAAGLSLGF